MRTLALATLVLLLSAVVCARDYHVSTQGNDTGSGSASEPLRTIAAAARLAQPGDVVIVHEGIYREKVVPARGGETDVKRITYRAEEGDLVEIRGSEAITGWTRFQKDVWKVTIPNSFFGDYNPYTDIIYGDWFNDHGRIHHSGAVYLNGKSFYETHTLEGVLNPGGIMDRRGEELNKNTWYCEHDDTHTFIYANFGGVNPNNEQVEINVRESCFYPDRPGINYITVRGFHMSHAATQWAPPTAEQIGLIGTHWSKGWIIENNVISESRCVGITLGKDRATGHNVWSANRCKDGATHYNEVIFRALKAGWSREMIGSHVVRNNTIFSCEQAGIVGSLGGVYSQIYNNHIFDIWTKRAFSGAEIAGIKIHASVDMIIRNNRIHNTGRGIWIDWMAQGTRITGNLLYDNTTDDLFSEVNHGPYVVDNNIFLSDISIRDWSGGGAFVHNLVAGKITVYPEVNRFTPYHFPHSTLVAGLKNIEGGDNRFYNNIFIGSASQAKERDFSKEWANYSDGLAVYSEAVLPMYAGGNLYYGGAQPMSLEPGYMVEDHDPMIRIEDDLEEAYLFITFHTSSIDMENRLLTSAQFNNTWVSNLPFEDPAGLPILFDKDYFQQTRRGTKPSPGPFEKIAQGEMKLKVW